MNKEREITAASYIYKFYTEIQSLNHEYSNYLNIMLELQNKYESEVEKAATANEKEVIKSQVQAVRYATHQTFIHYKSLFNGIDKESDETISEIYKKVTTNFIIDRGELEQYVTKINTVLIKNVIKNLLESSQELIQEIYKDANTKPTA